MAGAPRIPQVKLGQTTGNGIAPSMFALLDRGVQRRPELAAALRGRVAIRFTEDIASVRIAFGERVIRVEDGDFRTPDLAVSGRLAHVVQLTITPMRLGVPDVRDSRGREALLRVATGRVRLSGDLALSRRMLEMMAVPAPDGPHRGAPAARPREAAADDAVWIKVLT